MSGLINSRLKDRGIILPAVATPVGNYVATAISGSLLFISGQLPLQDGAPLYRGTLGGDVDLETGIAAARLCALNVVAQTEAALVDLDRVTRVVKLTGYVRSTADFTDQPKVLNGASDLMVEVFGDTGRHSRAAIGAVSLPMGAPVEVEAIVEFA